MQLGALEYLISVNNKGLISGINDSENRIKKSADNVGKKMQDIGNRLTSWTVAKGQMLAKFAESALSFVGNTAKSIMSDVVRSYADYEQLVGGVETLFKNSSATVMKYAEQAYLTAGLSANEYMQTVTSFSASLLQSLGGDTEKAADVADMALRDMSDNANKMGTSMESIQNAYQGFAKQNYTMLDNLKLGYGGTKSEMQRLLKDAEKITGVKYDINNLNDVYQAIHVIQTELGITGTTQEEAEKTISGSWARLKAAWQNLLVSFADPNGDVDKAMDAVFKSVKTLISRIRPVLRKAIKNMVASFGKALPEVLKIFSSDVLPGIKGTLHDVIEEVKKQGKIFKKSLAQWLQIENPDQASWIEIGKKIGGWVKQGIGKLIGADAGEDGEMGWGDIGRKIGKAITDLLSEDGLAQKILDNFIGSKSELVDLAKSIIEGAVTWLTDSENIAAVSGLIEKVATTLSELVGPVVDAISSIIENVILNDNVWNALLVLGDNLMRAIFGDDNLLSNIIGKRKKLESYYETDANGKQVRKTRIVDDDDVSKQTEGLVRKLVHAVFKTVFGEEFADSDFGKFFADMINNGGIIQYVLDKAVKFISENIGTVTEALSGIWESLKQTAEDTWNAIVGIVTPIWEDFKAFTLDPSFNNLVAVAKRIWDLIKTAISKIWNAFKTEVVEKVWENIQAEAEKVWNALVGAVSIIWESFKDSINRTFDNLIGSARRIWELIKTAVSKIWNTFKTEIVEKVWENLKGEAEKVWGEIVKAIETTWKTVETIILAPFKEALQIWKVVTGQAPIESLWGDGSPLWEAVEKLPPEVKDFFSSIGEPIINAVNQAEAGLNSFLNKPHSMSIYANIKGFDASKLANPSEDAQRQSFGGKSQYSMLNAKGNWSVPYDNFPALLHRDEMVLTKSQARRYRDGEGNTDYSAIGGMIGSSIRKAMGEVRVMMSGEKVGDLTTKRIKNNINANSYAKVRALGG
ncbi:MAG: hypothetical protein IKQ01_06545 [Bacteroidales bacterium]|nr:hypothetical protein [Bacteroidales bacterium]